MNKNHFMIPVTLSIVILLSLQFAVPAWAEEKTKAGVPLGMAVEFMDHAACAYVAKDKGWFKEAGLNVAAYKSYETGMALAAALARGDIQVAYMCLVPAINVYANAKVPIKIVAGTHKYGYGLVVNPAKIATVRDLEKDGLRVGCVREGGAADVLVLNKTIDVFRLYKEKVLKAVRRMNPPKLLLALRSGQLDAACLPEQWATMAEESGLHMLLTCEDVWPQAQGSVLVVKEDLLRDHPEDVKKLVRLTQRATDWINKNPAEAAAIVARQLSVTGEGIAALGRSLGGELEIKPQTISRSMARMVFTTDIDPGVVQDIIDYMAQRGYIKSGLKAEQILDLSYLNEN